MTPTSTRHARGFSLIEIVAAAALLMVLMLIVAPQLGGSTRGGDEQARFSVSAALSAELTAYSRYGQFASSSTLASDLPELEAISTESGSSKQVSISASGAVVGIAVKGSTTCWLARQTLQGTLWATSSGTCDGARALSVTADTTNPDLGSSPKTPIRL